MKRSKMSRPVDKKIFRRTAVKTKLVNIAPVVYRGGIRM